jgi:hypothetical protein
MSWVDQLPLETVQRIMHIIFPDSYEWLIQPETSRGADEEIFRYFTWSASSKHSHLHEVEEASVIIAVQPPWVCAPRNLERFTDCEMASNICR